MINKDEKMLKEKDMANISGGFYEEDPGVLPADYHKNIKCPNCQNDDPKKIKYESSGDILIPGHYHCMNCGKYFDPQN